MSAEARRVQLYQFAACTAHASRLKVWQYCVLPGMHENHQTDQSGSSSGSDAQHAIDGACMLLATCTLAVVQAPHVEMLAHTATPHAAY